VHLSLQAADRLASEGIEAEVLDLRTIVPMDRESIATTVRKTGKALIVHEANLTGGFGGEIAAYISEHLFEHLDAPVRRTTSLDSPVGFAKELEQQILVGTDDIAASARALAAY
jgi:2-oxoisovalerate dehydrogenase E1 component beta subunit